MQGELKILITGNREKDLCSELVPLLEARGHSCTCVSRATGYDFNRGDEAVHRVAELAEDHDVFINLYANFFFRSVILAQKIHKRWLDAGHSQRRILNVGSTTDRVKRGKANLYHYEKLALRELSSGLALIGVWEKGPKVSHISFGTLENRSADNPGRRCMTLQQAASYIVWMLEQPAELHINELSVDPVQYL